eukprot:767566-Hanusia_phi.AAC.10
MARREEGSMGGIVRVVEGVWGGRGGKERGAEAVSRWATSRAKAMTRSSWAATVLERNLGEWLVVSSDGKVSRQEGGWGRGLLACALSGEVVLCNDINAGEACLPSQPRRTLVSSGKLIAEEDPRPCKSTRRQCCSCL